MKHVTELLTTIFLTTALSASAYAAIEVSHPGTSSGHTLQATGTYVRLTNNTYDDYYAYASYPPNSISFRYHVGPYGTSDYDYIFGTSPGAPVCLTITRIWDGTSANLGCYESARLTIEDGLAVLAKGQHSTGQIKINVEPTK